MGIRCLCLAPGLQWSFRGSYMLSFYGHRKLRLSIEGILLCKIENKMLLGALSIYLFFISLQSMMQRSLCWALLDYAQSMFYMDLNYGASTLSTGLLCVSLQSFAPLFVQNAHMLTCA